MTSAIYLPTPEETSEYMKLLGISDDDNLSPKSQKHLDPSKYFAALCGAQNGRTDQKNELISNARDSRTDLKKRKNKVRYLIRSKSKDSEALVSDSDEYKNAAANRTYPLKSDTKRDKKHKQNVVKPLTNPKKFAMTKPVVATAETSSLNTDMNIDIMSDELIRHHRQGSLSSFTPIQTTNNDFNPNIDDPKKLARRLDSHDPKDVGTQTDRENAFNVTQRMKGPRDSRINAGVPSSTSPRKGKQIIMNNTSESGEQLSKSLQFEDISSTSVTSVMGDLTMVDKEGNTPLHVCCKSDDVQGAAFLLSTCPQMLGAVNNRNQLPITVAIKRGNEQIVELLLRGSSDRQLLDFPSLRNRPLLHTTARHGKDISMRHVLDEFKKRNIPAETLDMHGRSAAHVAAKYGNLVCLQTFLEYGMSLYEADKNGYTPSFYARYYGQRHVVGYFILLEVCLQLACGEDVGGTESEPGERFVKPTKRIRDQLISSITAIGRLRLEKSGKLDLTARCTGDCPKVSRSGSMANNSKQISKESDPDKFLLKVDPSTDERMGNTDNAYDQPMPQSLSTPIDEKTQTNRKTAIRQVTEPKHTPRRRLKSLEIDQPFFNPLEPPISMSWPGDTAPIDDLRTAITGVQSADCQPDTLDLRIEIPELRDIDNLSDSFTSPRGQNDSDKSQAMGISKSTLFSSGESTLPTQSFSRSSISHKWSYHKSPSRRVEQVRHRRGRDSCRQANTFTHCNPRASLDENILRKKAKIAQNKKGPVKLDMSLNEFSETYANVRHSCPVPNDKKLKQFQTEEYNPNGSPALGDDNIHDMLAKTLCGTLDIDSDRSSIDLETEDTSTISDGTSKFTTSEVICGITV